MDRLAPIALALAACLGAPSAALAEEADALTKIVRLPTPGESGLQGSTWSEVNLMLIALQTESGPVPLVEGWIGRDVFVRLSATRRTYYMFDRSASDGKVDICIVSLPKAYPIMLPDGAAASIRTAANCVATTDFLPYFLDATPDFRHSGEFLSAAEGMASDGTALKLRFVAHGSMPKEIQSELSTVGAFPRNIDARVNSIPAVTMLEFKDGRFALVASYAETPEEQSGACFIERADRSAEPPRESWLSPDVEQWCRAQEVKR